MITIPLSDARVLRAFEVLKKEHNEYDELRFSKLFEEVYRCKIVANPHDAFCLDGWMEIPEDKYANWFVLRFGDCIE